MVLTDNYIYVGNASNDPVGVAMSNDCTIASNGAITCDHDALDNYVANEHIDWTIDQGATDIHSGNYTAGYTDLTDFNQTAWRLFYSNNLGNVIELSLGADGEYLQSQGAASLTWSVPTDNDTTYTAGRSLTLDGTTINADAETYTGKHKIAFENPTADDDFFFGEVAATQTFTSIYCKTLVGTVDLDVQIAGSDINGTDITCNTTGVLDDSLGGDTAGAVGEELKLAITSVASDPTYLMVQVNYEYGD